jgi:alpha-amylase
VSLPDVRTEDNNVQSILYSWVTELVSNYSSKPYILILNTCGVIACLMAIFIVDGLRIDSVFNVDRGFWPGFSSAAGVYCVGEGNSQNATTLCPLQESLDGLLNYPLFVYHFHQDYVAAAYSLTLDIIFSPSRSTTLKAT